MPTTDLRTFLEISTPSMLMFGMRHALDVVHITSIDNLVRMHNAKKKTRWVGFGFSIGHILAVLSEMLLIIYVVGSTTSSKIDEISFWVALEDYFIRCNRICKHIFNAKVGKNGFNHSCKQSSGSNSYTRASWFCICYRVSIWYLI